MRIFLSILCTPIAPKRNGFGILKGKVTIADDFDAPWKSLLITNNL
jgi:hypothetical protein